MILLNLCCCQRVRIKLNDPPTFLSHGTVCPTTCFRAGDERINEQPSLAVVHILFFREHNRIARELKRINPSWDDERLYMEARRILNAEYQGNFFSDDC